MWTIIATMNSYANVRKVLVYTLFLYVVVAVAKLFYGNYTHSLSMTADGYHSLFDGTSNIVGLVGIWLAYHPPDKSHPYGHKKYETLASLVISVFLFLACYGVLKDAYLRFRLHTVPEVKIFSFVVMLVTIGINLYVMMFENKKGKELRSDILIADSLHTKSDIFASISVLVSLAAVYAGIPIIDPIAAFVIALLIGRTGYEILYEATKVLSDYSRINPSAIRKVALGVNGVNECHDIRTRGSATDVYVDLRLHVPSDLKIEDAHDLAHKVEDRIKEEFTTVTEVVVHVEPEDSAGAAKGNY
ncbi:MAG: cation diffusion facilitator family transporter [Nitrospira sp.]|nr:cation diffusion facilitator family transporter [Nitrospira sp.]